MTPLIEPLSSSSSSYVDAVGTRTVAYSWATSSTSYLGSGCLVDAWGRTATAYYTSHILMELRANIDINLPLDSQVDQISFMEWDKDSWDLGGYEYDVAQQKLVIKLLPNALHGYIVDVFTGSYKK